jgi:hypothetical protein
MIVTAHQPLYMPWLGFFHKAYLADVICILDNVQFSKGDFVNRNRIKSGNGAKWLTIPVHKKGHLNGTIKDIEISGQDWALKHINLIRESYVAAPYFAKYFSHLENLLYSVKSFDLAHVNVELLDFFLQALNIETRIVLSSEMNIKSHKSDLILAICDELKADVYVSGINGKSYLQLQDFDNAKIKVVAQSYNHPRYLQLHGDFISNLSIIDLLFTSGEKSKDILLGGNKLLWNQLDCL